MRASLVGGLVVLLWSHMARPAAGQETMPVIEGYRLKASLSSIASRVLSCNPGADRPPPSGRLGRFCWASNSLILNFDKLDSLEQMQLEFDVFSPDGRANAEALWRQRSGFFSDMMRQPPDTIVMRPVGQFNLNRRPDPRGSRARIVRACWLMNSRRRWHGNVWLYDRMTTQDSPSTHVLVEVLSYPPSRPGCLIGPPS
jgi:hypothetical protein